jgi:hypothetical protein
VKKLISAVTPVKTGVQSIRKALKTLDSGFRRNDVKKSQINFFTPSPLKGEGIFLFQYVHPPRARERASAVSSAER